MSRAAPPIVSSRPRLAGAVVVALCLFGCADERRIAYDAYTARIDPLLEQESERWSRVKGLLQERQNDPALPRYWRYLRETAVPFYEGMRRELNDAKPDDVSLQAAHVELVHFAEARLEFVFAELATEDLNREAAAEDGLMAVFSGQADADGLRIEYARSVQSGTPDAKLGELYEIVNTFRKRYFEPMREGAKDAAEVQLQLKSSVIPRLEELRHRKYAPEARLLRECVAAWHDWHVRLQRVCPLLQRMYEANQRSEGAAKAAEDAFSAFREELKRARLAD